MESNYEIWSSFFYSKGTVTNYTRSLKSLFRNFQYVSNDTFLNYNELQSLVSTILRQNMYTQSIIPRRNDIDIRNDIDYEQDDDIVNSDELLDIVDHNNMNIVDISNLRNLRSSSIVHKLYAIKSYIDFLGIKHKNINTLLKQVSRRSRNQTEGEFVTMYLDHNYTVKKINTITLTLLKRQQLIDRFILGFFDQDYETQVQIGTEFGAVELQPFLELCIRLYIVPLNTANIKYMTIYPSIVSTRESKLLLEKTMLKSSHIHTTYIYIRSDNSIHLSYMIQNSEQTKRVVHIAIPDNLKYYILFFLIHCRGYLPYEKKKIRKKQTLYSGFKLFLGRPFFSENGIREWQRIVKDIRTYCHKIQMKDQLLHLNPGHNYVFNSKLLWIFRNSLKYKQDHTIDVEVLSHYAYITGISTAVGQSMSYYYALDSLKNNFEAMKYLGYNILQENNPYILEIAPCHGNIKSLVNISFQKLIQFFNEYMSNMRIYRPYDTNNFIS